MGPEVTEHTGFLEFTLPRHSEQEGGWGGGGGGRYRRLGHLQRRRTLILHQVEKK